MLDALDRIGHRCPGCTLDWLGAEGGAQPGRQAHGQGHLHHLLVEGLAVADVVVVVELVAVIRGDHHHRVVEELVSIQGLHHAQDVTIDEVELAVVARL